MSTPSQEARQPLTAADVAQGLCTRDERRVALSPKRGGTHRHVEVFWEMAALFQEAMEEVRTIRATRREGSQYVRGQSADLRAHSTKLREQSTRVRERMALPDGRSAALREAESRRLEMVRGDHYPSKERP
jgi:hypothetical protein